MSQINPQWTYDSCRYAETFVVANTTGTRVCGIQGNTTDAISSCCDTPIQFYQCWMYCQYSDTIGNFAKCIQDSGRANISTGGPSSNVFCQGSGSTNLTTTLDDTKTSSSFRSYSTPKLSWLTFALLFVVLFVSPSSASIIPSLDDGLTRRQMSGNNNCTFDLIRNYTRLGDTFKASPDFNCDTVAWCPQIAPIETWPVNRTINLHSAAEPGYDAFFELVGNVTNRPFPAQSSMNITYEFVGSGTFYARYSPIFWCANGTATQCGGVLGSTDEPFNVEACGPLFVNGSNSEIQLSLGSVGVA